MPLIHSVTRLHHTSVEFERIIRPGITMGMLEMRLIKVGVGLLLHFGQLDAEGGALVDFRFLHIDFASVIFFDDALHQCQS